RFQGLRPIAEVQRKGDKMEAVFGISGGQISSDMTRDGRRVELVFLGQIFDEKGKAVSDKLPISRYFSMSLSDDQYQGLTSQDLTGHQELDLPPGTYNLTLVAEDRVAGTLGAQSVEFTVY
ncbi:MAG TPA: hypothetical protein VLU25_09295, partial [Acidobacteriota bacterium]|nr:hypothetical protein [Acidobacteriota bacterium]